MTIGAVENSSTLMMASATAATAATAHTTVMMMIRAGWGCIAGLRYFRSGRRRSSSPISSSQFDEIQEHFYVDRGNEQLKFDYIKKQTIEMED